MFLIKPAIEESAILSTIKSINHSIHNLNTFLTFTLIAQFFINITSCNRESSSLNVILDSDLPSILLSVVILQSPKPVSLSCDDSHCSSLHLYHFDVLTCVFCLENLILLCDANLDLRTLEEGCYWCISAVVLIISAYEGVLTTVNSGVL